jgi:sulfur relay (sulfurtransferase) complex TusBCD TusD component (DsrE family)
MRKLNTVLLGLLAAGLIFAGNAQAEEDKSMGLFLNLSSIETGVAGHALHFAGKQMERGHPVTVFLNGPAVLFGSKSAPQATFSMAGTTVRDMLDGMVKDGAKLIMCQMCAKMRGMDPSDFIDGAELGNPELVASSLFDPKYQVISW